MRYFIEVSYKGTNYSGFQVQKNAATVQGEIEKAFLVFFKQSVELTGSSRTDAGVHAVQNFFHFDSAESFESEWIYNLNAILPSDIVIRKVSQVDDRAHCRFDAISRRYEYSVYQFKNPFLADTAYFYPYKLDKELLQKAALIIKEQTDFTSFSKRHTQVNNFNCVILESQWIFDDDIIKYRVTANRFLRGMVRALTATMLKVGRKYITLEDFQQIICNKDCSKTYFDTPAHGLSLIEVSYTENIAI